MRKEDKLIDLNELKIYSWEIDWILVEYRGQLIELDITELADEQIKRAILKLKPLAATA